MATTRRNQFPAGMRVLAIDDDRVCLKVLETLLRRCHYEVTSTNQAAIALKMLRENRDMFDLVISDVHMPGMDGIQLLELVGQEMDLPVIMLSVNAETKSVMKGITHGACDYLLKPVRIEELTNIWQHVVRSKLSGANSDNVYYQVTCGSFEQSGRSSYKRKAYRSEEEDEDEESNVQDNDKTYPAKKPRIVWTVQMHTKFVTVVNQLGIDKVVPKRILELMNVKDLTRENVQVTYRNTGSTSDSYVLWNHIKLAYMLLWEVETPFFACMGLKDTMITKLFSPLLQLHLPVHMDIVLATRINSRQFWHMGYLLSLYVEVALMRICIISSYQETSMETWSKVSHHRSSRPSCNRIVVICPPLFLGIAWLLARLTCSNKENWPSSHQLKFHLQV